MNTVLCNFVMPAKNLSVKPWFERIMNKHFSFCKYSKTLAEQGKGDSNFLASWEFELWELICLD